MARKPAGPLAGVTVLDFTWAAVGPYATFLLSLLGARVIRIESPLPAHRQRVTSGFFQDLNLPKTTVLVDLKDERGLELALKLAEKADVVVDNYRPGVMERLGIGQEALRARNQSLVVVSTSTMGSTGPQAAFGGYAPIFSALGGLAELTGYPDGPPTEIRHPVDFSLGSFVAMTIVAALLRRAQIGKGAYLDISGREAVVQLIGDALIDYQLTGRVPERQGNEDVIMAPHGVYRCRGAESWVSVAVATDVEWRGLAAAIGRPELADDPAYGDAYRRWQRRAELDELLGAWTEGLTAGEAGAVLQAAGVPAAPCNSARDLFEDDHLAERGFATTVRVGGRDLVQVGAPWKLSGTPSSIPVGPGRAKARRDVFAGLLGLTAEYIDELRRDGVIG
jgi:crotonobetainyl-CoA:carnitine CoA-transferase CaiB-like acyl-CoA transferase